jgi:hypothetical protein
MSWRACLPALLPGPRFSLGLMYAEGQGGAT